MQTDSETKPAFPRFSGVSGVGELFVFLVCCAVVFIPQPALAAGEIANNLCWVTEYLTGMTGKAIATVGVSIVGIMALYGRASWGTAFVTAAAIAIIFGAAGIVQDLGQSYACTSSPPKFQCVGPTPVGSLFDVDTMATAQGAANAQTPTPGSPQSSQSCVQTASGQTGNCGIFARVLWMFKTTVGDVMSSMYCGFSDALRKPLSAALTVFVAIYGVMILTGIAQFKVKDAGIVLFKFSLVWAFATNADWGIGIGYNFFMNFAEEGSNIVLGAMPHSPGNAAPSLSSPDQVIASIFTKTTGDPSTSTTSDTPIACILFLEIIAFFLILFMPIILIFIFLIIISYIGNFARALLNYLTCLVLISFLFILAPFFLGFALFRTTMPLFEGWLKHLIAFSLQMVIMFGFMALLAMIPFADFFNELLNLLKGYSMTFNVGPAPFILAIPLSMCGICHYHITPSSVDAAGHYTAAAIACVSHPLDLTGLTQDQQHAALLNAMTKATKLKDDIGQGGYMLSDDHQFYVMALPNLIQHTDFAKFVIIQAMSLYLISKVVGDFMLRAPQLAAAIGKLPIAAALGGGATPGGVKIGYVGIESIQAAYIGMKNALRQIQINPLRNPLAFGKRLRHPGEAMDAWKKGIKGAVSGAWQGFLGGAADITVDNINRQKRIDAARKRLAPMEEEHKRLKNDLDKYLKEHEDAKKRGDSPEEKQQYQNMVTMSRRLKKLDNEMAYENRMIMRLDMERMGSAKAGIINTLGRPGSSMNIFNAIHSPGDETSQHFNRMKSKQIQRSMYGKVLDDHESGYYGFMKIPQDVNKTEIAPTLGSYAAKATDKIAHLKLMLMNPGLSDDKRRKLTAALSSVENAASSAGSADSGSEHAIRDVLDQLDAIERDIH